MSQGADTQAVLAIKSARVRFPKLLALRDVSFSLGPGQLLGLIGPNGAGKTTLLRALAGLQPLTRGQVLISGQPLSTQTVSIVGFTPDVPPVYEDLTVRQFLRFISLGYGISKSETGSRIDFWLEQVWLREKADQKIKALSRGMKQRIGIARTMLPDPSIVLLDEPAAGLDPAGRVQFRELLLDLRARGKTIIISSHILSDMSEYCTHIGIMAHGAMLQFGTVEEIARGRDNQRCRYAIALARPLPDLPATLQEIELITDVVIDQDKVTFEYASSRELAAALLARLIGVGVPVASFSPVTSNLEQAYLRTGIEQVD